MPRPEPPRLDSLELVHPVLLRKVLAVLHDVRPKLPRDWELEVFETHRTPERQRWLFDHGRSKIRSAKGKHCQSPAEAVDVVFKYKGRWTWDAPYWTLVDRSAVAHNLRRITWDKPHLELKAEDG